MSSQEVNTLLQKEAHLRILLKIRDCTMNKQVKNRNININLFLQR